MLLVVVSSFGIGYMTAVALSMAAFRDWKMCGLFVLAAALNGFLLWRALA